MVVRGKVRGKKKWRVGRWKEGRVEVPHMQTSDGTHVNEWWHRCEWVNVRSTSCVTWLIYMCDMTHLHMFHKTHSHVCNVTNTNEWFHTYILTMRKISKSRCKHTCEWIMAHMWMCHVTDMYWPCERLTRIEASTNMNESWHTCEWVMSNMRRSHGAHINESWHTCKWVMAHMWRSHDKDVHESTSEVLPVCDMTHSYVWYDSYT